MKYTGLGRELCSIAAGATIVLLLPATSADAANTTGTQVYSGNGWKALPGIKSLSADGTGYTIQFASADARTKLGPAAKQAAAQLTSVTGIKFTVSTVLKASPEGCAVQHLRSPSSRRRSPRGSRSGRCGRNACARSRTSTLLATGRCLTSCHLALCAA